MFSLSLCRLALWHWLSTRIKGLWWWQGLVLFCLCIRVYFVDFIILWVQALNLIMNFVCSELGYDMMFAYECSFIILLLIYPRGADKL